MTPDLSLLIVVLLSLRFTCHVSAIGLVDPIRF